MIVKTSKGGYENRSRAKTSTWYATDCCKKRCWSTCNNCSTVTSEHGICPNCNYTRGKKFLKKASFQVRAGPVKRTEGPFTWYLVSMRIEFVLNLHSWQCEFNAHYARSNEQLGRSDSMRIKGLAILCHLIIARWRTACKWRPFSAFVSVWVHPPDMHLASTSLSFMTLQWCLVVLGVVWEGNVSHDFRPSPRISIVIRFESTSNLPPDVDWTNVHWMSIKLMRIQ